MQEIFLHVTKSTRNVLHSNLLRSKAEYYIKCYIVDIREIYTHTDGYYKYCKLRKLLHDSASLTAAKGILTYAKVMDVWQKNGPVAAKLFTWITNRETGEDSDKILQIHNTHAASCVTEYQYVTLQLPSCDKNMVIYELSIHVICGDLDATTGYRWRSTREGPKHDVCTTNLFGMAQGRIWGDSQQGYLSRTRIED
ncbi:hypothetical protein OS493_002370 [Desmophyllum pertusum]|uniref:Uncharacterized protein n=1 Tax=Desmophyllum pertusum TaxID=174260 RepID=A0A9W9YSX5_9CNID|nr:hypothetical protein OS493_002370 [Desmophyllum pertusum]